MLSPERLQGHRAAIIATALAGAEILGAQGALAQEPTPQPDTQSASITQTQIIGEVPFNLYAADWLMFPRACVIPPGAEPTPNVIPAAKVNNTAQAIENPAPSIILAKQTLSDGSTLICSLPNKPEAPKPVEHNLRDFMQSKEPRKGSLGSASKLAKEVFKDPQATSSYMEAIGVNPNDDLKKCKDKKIALIDREGYCMSATAGLFVISKDQTVSSDIREKAWQAASQLYNWEVTSPTFPKGMKDFVDSFLVDIA